MGFGGYRGEGIDLVPLVGGNSSDRDLGGYQEGGSAPISTRIDLESI